MNYRDIKELILEVSPPLLSVALDFFQIPEFWNVEVDVKRKKSNDIVTSFSKKGREATLTVPSGVDLDKLPYLLIDEAAKIGLVAAGLDGKNEALSSYLSSLCVKCLEDGESSDVALQTIGEIVHSDISQFIKMVKIRAIVEAEA